MIMFIYSCDGGYHRSDGTTNNKKFHDFIIKNPRQGEPVQGFEIWKSKSPPLLFTLRCPSPLLSPFSLHASARAV